MITFKCAPSRKCLYCSTRKLCQSHSLRLKEHSSTRCWANNHCWLDKITWRQSCLHRLIAFITYKQRSKTPLVTSKSTRHCSVNDKDTHGNFNILMWHIGQLNNWLPKQLWWKHEKIQVNVAVQSSPCWGMAKWPLTCHTDCNFLIQA